MKKVLFLVESLSGGGAEKVLLTLIKNLNKEKYDITVYSIVKTGVYVRKIEQYCKLHHGLKDYTEYSYLGKLYFRIKNKFIYKLPSKLIYKWLIKDKYDVEVAFLEGFSTKLVASSNNKNSKKIAWVHIDMITRDYADKMYKSLQQHIDTYKIFDKVIAVSDDVKQCYIQKFNLNNIETRYNPIDEIEINELSLDMFDYDEKYLNFVTIGRLEYQKGYDRLLRIVKKLNKDYECFKLYIIGEGSLKGEFIKFIEDNKLNNKVYLLGFKENPYRYLKGASAFICSSYAEGFSTVATEAMILGVPIITVECSGMKELFGNYECGIICKNKEEDLYKSMKKILDNPELLIHYRNNIVLRKKFFKLKKRMEEVESVL